MTHRSGTRETIMNSGAEGEGLAEIERARAARRGRSATPGLTSLWDENRRLYMDNLRLWDCLTLVRGDPTMNCQNAIKLVFGLEDNDYLRMFPDTKQLMLLMFPGGVVYHTSSEEARVENARLKDENARLHAAVWVLRDNPSLQADSTVAAIFRLNEEQFLSKFHADLASPQDTTPASTSSKYQYQNNNKEKKKSYRTSLDLGQEPAMAIHLTNRPIKRDCVTCDKLGSKASRRQRSHSMVAHTFSTRNGSSIHHQDFTSNWKQTTPPEVESAADSLETGADSHLNSEWSVLCWHQNYCLQPVSLNTLEEAKSTGDAGGYCKHTKTGFQIQEAMPKNTKIRELWRSHSLSREGNILAERVSKGLPHAVPIRCVSFAEPLSSCKTSSTAETEFLSFRGNDKVILDAKYNHNCHALSKEEQNNHCQTAAVEVCDLTKNGNSNREWQEFDKSPDVYAITVTREPSKRYQRYTATSPVLDTKACFLILGQSNKPTLQENGAPSKSNCITSASYEHMSMLNTSNNSDADTSSKFTPANSSGFTRINYVRPLSPKRRDFRQARMKNMISFEKIKNKHKVESKQEAEIAYNTNNALNDDLRSSIHSRVHLNSHVTVFYPPEVDEYKEIEELTDDAESNFESQLKRVSTASSAKPADDIFTQRIFFSHEPTPAEAKRSTPYSIKSYPTVKHFLDRHRRIMQETISQTPTEIFTREITPSVAMLVDSRVSTPKLQENITDEYSDAETQLQTPRIFHDTTISEPQQPLAYKYKDKWIKPEDYHGRFTSFGSSTLNSKPGKLKRFEKSQNYSTVDKLKELKKLGNFKYSKPLAVMLLKNGKYETKNQDMSLLTSTKAQTIRLSPLPGHRMMFKPKNSFITFIPRE